MLQLLTYNDLNVPDSLKTQTERVFDALSKGDFRAADVKKMVGTDGYYRAKLDDKNRLLFRIGRYEGLTYLLVLETILNHDYSKSRFLNGRGGQVDESKLLPIASSDVESEQAVAELVYVNQHQRHFHMLDKVLSFDAAQEEVFSAPAPLITIGSAGSGKTALTLEKIKRLSGQVLYVTLSPFLVENARQLYHAQGYENEAQTVDFLSYTDFLRTIGEPKGKEMDFRNFNQWIARHKQAFHIRDTHKIFEEFRGVLSGNAVDRAYLSLDDYLNLGVRDSVFLAEERPRMYQLFQKYLAFIQEGKFHDSNLASFSFLDKIEPRYDFVVVDEVQDFTNVQLSLILKALTQPGQFMLSGDSNQIVHPNFFSWKSVKTMFYKSALEGDIIRLLTTNYRNSPEVTQMANRLLLVKNLRFGSIDRESTYLINANNSNNGEVQCFQDQAEVLKGLNRATGRSTQFAVIVMRNEDKEEAQKLFSTPLIFSVKEAKGLEYRNIILYNMISQNEKEFRDICAGVQAEDLQQELVYNRAKDKTDRSLETYKFYVNSLYVAITRAINNLYVVERCNQHDLWSLLGVTEFATEVNIAEQSSSHEEWQREANRLEKQGKLEQADGIKKQVLREVPVPWDIITVEKYSELKNLAFDENHFNLKAKEKVYDYTAWYNIYLSHLQLKASGYKRESGIFLGRRAFLFRTLPNYVRDNPAMIQKDINRYGVNYRTEFNYTPLMMAAEVGAVKIAQHLISLGADRELQDNYGRTAFMQMLHNAYVDPKYAKEKLATLYPILCPDTLKIGVMEHMCVLSSGTPEFLLMALVLATFRFEMTNYMKADSPAIQIDRIVKFMSFLPDSIIPAYRKKKEYILHLFAKHEMFRPANNNARAFLRMGRGKYVITPGFGLYINDEFCEVLHGIMMNDNFERDILGYHYEAICMTFKKGLDGIVTPDEEFEEEMGPV